MPPRRSVLGLALAGMSGACATRAGPAPGVVRQAVGFTFLRSLDPDPAALVKFVEWNWLAMDEAAKAQGLMTDYAVYAAAPGGDLDWNVLVEVGYPDARGYDAIASAFEVIRKAHIVQPVDGKTLRELGRIVRSVTLTPGRGSL